VIDRHVFDFFFFGFNTRKRNYCWKNSASLTEELKELTSIYFIFAANAQW